MASTTEMRWPFPSSSLLFFSSALFKHFLSLPSLAGVRNKLCEALRGVPATLSFEQAGRQMMR